MRDERCIISFHALEKRKEADIFVLALGHTWFADMSVSWLLCPELVDGILQRMQGDSQSAADGRHLLVLR